MAIFLKLWITKLSRFILGDNSAETQEFTLYLYDRECYNTVITYCSNVYREVSVWMHWDLCSLYWHAEA